MFREEGKVSRLIESGARLEERNGSGDTPLLFMRVNQYAVGTVLLEAGSDPRARDRAGHDICYRVQQARYAPPPTGPDPRSTFLIALRRRGVVCEASAAPI